MKIQIFLCVSTLAIFISAVNCQFPGFGTQYDLQGYGSDFGVVDPLVALRLKNFKKLSKLSLGCEHAAGKAMAIKSKCSKLFTEQLMKNKLALQGLNSQFNGFPDQLCNLNQGQLYNSQPSIISAAQLQGASPQCLQNAAAFPSFQSAALPNFQSAALPNFQSAALPNFQSAALPNFQSASLPDFQGAALPNFQSAALQNLPASVLSSLQGSALPNLRASSLQNLPNSVLSAALQGLQESTFPNIHNIRSCSAPNVQSCPLPNGQNPAVQVQNIQIPFDQIQRMSSEPMEFGTPIDHRIYNISPNQNIEESLQRFGPQPGFQQQLNPQSGPCMGGSQFEQFGPIGSPETQYSDAQQFDQNGAVQFPQQFGQSGAAQFPSGGEYEERPQAY